MPKDGWRFDTVILVYPMPGGQILTPRISRFSAEATMKMVKNKRPSCLLRIVKDKRNHGRT